MNTIKMWGGGGLDRFLSIIYANSLRRLGIKLAFSISNSEIGYGLVIPHYGTIVIGGGNRIKEYCVLHTCTCITAGHKEIGKGFYLSTGAKVVHDITINDYVSVGANSLVNKDIIDSNVMIAGCPARIIKKSDEWYIRDGKEFQKRMLKCEELKNLFNLDEN